MMRIALTGVESCNHTKNLSYDTLGEVTKDGLLNSNGSLVKKQVYGYDPNGNRLSRDQTDGSGHYMSGEANGYDAGNELTQIQHYVGPTKTLNSTESFVAVTDFDNNENQLVSTGGKTTSFSYYPDNRLKQIVPPPGQVYTNSGYYDDGRLSYHNTVYFYYVGDSGQRLEDVDTQQPVSWLEATTNEYFGGDLVIQYAYASGYNQPVGIAFTWMFNDPLGNIGTMTDQTGTVVSTCTQDLYGTNAQPGAGQFQWECASGYVYNSSPTPGGVYQLENRAYDPAQGRFLQQDPLSDGQGDWTYAGNSPGNAVDPTGLDVVAVLAPSGYGSSGSQFTGGHLEVYVGYTSTCGSWVSYYPEGGHARGPGTHNGEVVVNEPPTAAERNAGLYYQKTISHDIALQIRRRIAASMRDPGKYSFPGHDCADWGAEILSPNFPGVLTPDGVPTTVARQFNQSDPVDIVNQ